MCHAVNIHYLSEFLQLQKNYYANLQMKKWNSESLSPLSRLAFQFGYQRQACLTKMHPLGNLGRVGSQGLKLPLSQPGLPLPSLLPTPTHSFLLIGKLLFYHSLRQPLFIKEREMPSNSIIAGVILLMVVVVVVISGSQWWLVVVEVVSDSCASGSSS